MGELLSYIPSGKSTRQQSQSPNPKLLVNPSIKRRIKGDDDCMFSKCFRLVYIAHCAILLINRRFRRALCCAYPAIFVADGEKSDLQGVEGYLLRVAGNTETFQLVISEQVADRGLSLEVVKSEDKAFFHKLNLISPAAYMRTDVRCALVLEHIPVIAAVDDIVPVIPVAHRVYEEEQDIPGCICSPVSGAAEP